MSTAAPLSYRESQEPTLAAPRVVAERSTLRRVLLVKLSSLGDIVHALPLADALRAALPDTFLAWAVRGRFRSLLEGNPNLDTIYSLEGKGVGALRSLRSELRTAAFDAALDAQGLLISGLVTRLSGARLRIGLDGNREGNALFLTHPVVPARGRWHMVDKLLAFCDTLGIPRLPPRVQTYLADGEGARADELVAEAGEAPRIGLIVGASTADKAWPIGRWVELAQQLTREGVRPVLLGGAGETERAAAIVREARGAVAANLTGRTPLGVLASVLARCAVVVGGDSGPAHLAVAVGTPVVGLYGVTDPSRTGPAWGPAPAVVLDYNEEASPETRRPRHSAVPDAIARIPAQAAAEAVLALANKSV